MIFGDYNLPHNDYITVYEAMLEIYDAAISGKKEMLHMLRKTAAFDEEVPVDKMTLSHSTEPDSPPEFEDLPKLAFSDCYKVLPDDYRDRLDILNESLSSDSDGPSTSSSWFTFSSGKSSLRSSFEVHDDQRDLKKMPSVDEEPISHAGELPCEFDRPNDRKKDGVNVFLVDGENAGDLIFGEVDNIPFSDYVAEHLITLDRVSDSELIAELMDASLRFWSEDVSSESDPQPPDMECFSLDESELAKTSTPSARPDSSPIPKITIDGIDERLTYPKKKRKRKKKTKSRSPDFLPFPETFMDLRLDTQAPPNTPISSANVPVKSPLNLPAQLIFDKALKERRPLVSPELDPLEEKPSSPYPSNDTVDRLHLLLDKTSPVLESLSETEEEDMMSGEVEPSSCLLKIHPKVSTQLPPHHEPAQPPLSPVSELSETPDLDFTDQGSDLAQEEQHDSADRPSNSDSDAPSKPPKPTLSSAQKRRLKKKKLCWKV